MNEEEGVTFLWLQVLDWSIKYRFFDLKKITVFVLDEADVMIATQGHQDQSIRIHKNLSPTCQMMLFSATYDLPVMNFAENIIADPVIIRLRREEESIDNIGQYWVDCATAEAKFIAISNIYGVVTIGQAMIFCQVCILCVAFSLKKIAVEMFLKIFCTQSVAAAYYYQKTLP